MRGNNNHIKAGIAAKAVQKNNVPPPEPEPKPSKALKAPLIGEKMNRSSQNTSEPTTAANRRSDRQERRQERRSNCCENCCKCDDCCKPCVDCWNGCWYYIFKCCGCSEKDTNEDINNTNEAEVTNEVVVN
jgi:hypothetical protein